ncbi:hypothetical protein AVEN_28076-1 [Araneus ventricosus]|uniref:Uncharacterized protein n=1 Tax=Araneus ventricosus TaxID=182803 RepID=A0A4Y2CNF1_ARAVE|nr:hypothetical protein AVEN_245088-1 [Araneus ventricosus]GBM06037.1 hypothetical protein AVEN_28076-1 [Araneus ventricosus]
MAGLSSLISLLRVPLMTTHPNAFSPLSEQQPAQIRPSSIEVAWAVTAGLGVTVLKCIRPIHDGSSVESDFEPGAYLPQSRNLTTTTPRPPPFSWKQVVFSIKRGRIAHLFQKPTLHLGIGLCLYEQGYELNFLPWCPHILSKLGVLENEKTV